MLFSPNGHLAEVRFVWPNMGTLVGERAYQRLIGDIRNIRNTENVNHSLNLGREGETERG